MFSPLLLLAQKKNSRTNAPDNLLEILFNNILEGDKIAFRDLAKLYDKLPKNQSIKNRLKRHTLFTKSEWDWEATNHTETLTHFFYQNEENFRFSELLKVFYLSPIEERMVTAKIQPKIPIQIDPFLIKETVTNIDHYLSKKKFANLLKEIDYLGAIHNPTVSAILNELITKKEIQKLKKEKKNIVIPKILSYLSDSLAFEQLLILTKKRALPFDFCQQSLANLSNNFFAVNTHEELVAEYKKLRTSLGNNLMVIKEYGYQKIDLTPALFFKEKVDYYGWMLATNKDSLFWIQRNALADLLNTKHPKALFYTIGLQFKAWKAGDSNMNRYLKLVQNNIDVEVKIKDKNDWINAPTSAKSQLNYLVYWASHFEDYEWDDSQQKYINQLLFSNELENYDRYFRRLNSTNDSIAKIAFAALSEGKPNEIQKLLKKFKPLLRNYNARLPPLKYKIIEQISLLVDFCKQNNYNYHPNNALKKSLEKLSSELSPKERLRLENRLIETLSLSDLTAIEYYAAIHAQNLALNYSSGRILDYSYTKNWKNILSNEHNFRFYLLKMQLFQDFGGFGINKKYANKIDWRNPITVQLLENLHNLETNAYIRQSVNYFLAQKEKNSPTSQLTQFLAAPKDIKTADLKKLPPFKINNLPQIIAILFQQEDKNSAKNIGKYLELYASINMVPQLFETPQKQWIKNINAGKALVKILERVYQFSFSSKQQESILNWWNLWRTNPEDYTNWSQRLFQQQLSKLTTATNLTIDDINKITTASFYEPTHRAICLESLKKVRRIRTIYRLKIVPKVSVKEELFYLEGIDFSYKELDNLCKIFQLDAPQKLLNFISQRVTNSNIKEQSSLYNNLFRQQWFIEHVTKGNIAPKMAENIKTVFYKYLFQSTFLTEFEEKNTQINIIQLENAYKNLKEKLIQIAKDSLNEGIRYQYLNSILSRMEFHEIIIVFPILKNVEITNKNLFTFLNKDFGLPLFKFDTQKEEKQVFKQLSNQTEYEFYQQTLLDFGLPIANKGGSLNYQKIDQLLEYDLVVPFIGEGGQYRDFYVYGLIKLLELHFKTTLGFHPKLNENQIFYTFNSYKRVEAWREYLVTKKLVVPHRNQSFK